ncbi:MAG: MlaD family protein [Paludibacteraceae bacterium]|nr:MlaD family protein [Paludibacteraceae bacterium]
MNFKISKELQIGIWVIVTLAVTFFGVNYLKGKNIFNPTNYYYLKFSHINGLVETNDVTVKGYKVGLVQRIIYDYDNPNADVVVMLQVDDDLKIPVGSKAALVSALIGSPSIELRMGPSSSEIYQRGDTIPSYVDDGIMNSITEEVMPRIQTIIPQLDSLIISLHAIAENKTIENSLENLNTITKNLSKASVGINRIVDKDVPQLCNNFNNVMGNLNKVSSNLSGVDFRGTVNNLNKTLVGVQGITDKLNNGSGSLGLLLTNKDLYNNLNTTINSANELVVDIREHPKRYINVSVFGRKGE